VDHECHILPPEALQAERSDDVPRAVDIIEKARPLRHMRRGVKSTGAG
jgi:hypothetical protein